MTAETLWEGPVREKDREDKRKLRHETAAWQWAVLGVFLLSLGVNLCQTARILSLEDARTADAEQLRQAEHVRDLALRELGELSERWVEEREARALQAAAYEEIGDYRYIGRCTITAYCACAECCGKWADGLTATGIPVTPGIVAVDRDVIPLGSTVVIDGQKYLAADTGVTGNCVDIFMIDHQETIRHGVREAEVWVVEP